MQVHDYPKSGFPAGCSDEAVCMVHGFLFLFRVKNGKGLRLGSWPEKWIGVYESSVFDLLHFFVCSCLSRLSTN